MGKHEEGQYADNLELIRRLQFLETKYTEALNKVLRLEAQVKVQSDYAGDLIRSIKKLRGGKFEDEEKIKVLEQHLTRCHEVIGVQLMEMVEHLDG